MFSGDWVLTGDYAKIDEDGYFWYEGRRDDLIKSAGYRIGPAEVEDTLVSHPAVEEAAVVGVADQERGQVVKAFVRLAAGCHTFRSARRRTAARMSKPISPPTSIPRIIEFVDQFPLTSTGKISRKDLRAREPPRLSACQGLVHILKKSDQETDMTFDRRTFLGTAIAATAIGHARPARAKTTLKLNSQWPATTAGSKVDQWFADEVKKRTNGEVEIRIFWSEALGKANENLSLMQNGAVEMGAMSPRLLPEAVALPHGAQLDADGDEQRQAGERADEASARGSPGHARGSQAQQRSHALLPPPQPVPAGLQGAADNARLGARQEDPHLGIGHAADGAGGGHDAGHAVAAGDLRGPCRAA
jgi:hypothetical protein